MVNNLKHFAGIDISKRTFDITVSIQGSDSEYSNFPNSKKGFKQLLKWLKSLGISLAEILFCMENTGIYHRSLVSFLLSLESLVWVESGAQIKLSGGIQRGKNDKVDSKRIMDYAKRNKDQVKLYQEKSPDLQKIADLLGLRRRLVQSIKSLKTPIKELKEAGLKQQAAVIHKASRRSIKALELEIKIVEDTIKKTISDNEQLKEIYNYAVSVKSIGFVAACQLLVYTNGFTKFNSSKQIASYCGIAPFEFTSGTSVRGRTRVHHMANKELKTTLHMCAISSLAHNEEMKIYCERKVKEGKNKMLILNSIRNKLLSRVFSCVKNKKMYVPHIAA